MNPLIGSLNALLAQANGRDIRVKSLLGALSGKGQPALLIIFSLPFCQPIPIPGVSTAFGLILSLIGFHMSLGRKMWLPNWLLEKELSYSFLKKVIVLSTTLINKLRFLVSTRMVWLVNSPVLSILHGLVISILSVLLALPIPIPLGNMFTASPILVFGLAILEEDGLAIMLAYALTVLSFLLLALAIWIGEEGIVALWPSLTASS
ncbi:exopolysaccharide biosynthesis protein [Candidatus Protochlamydia phocaeensis]|uniref:exopolysaccharide biosynthesis protein n=1 Tax=Candidatus Protochlamydia phocaeensis TaxID=1414722 RepID=UPI001896749D|nr:exopolysaccharide biosynthesis protein [Candidatus Protochlamydia phocaeensis]